MKQTVSVEDLVTLYPKNLLLKFRNEHLKYEIYLNGARVSEAQDLTNEDVVAISFIKRINRNDTIQMDLDGFLYCRSNPINVGNINLVFIGD